MATLPGVSTVLRDRFFQLSRTDIPTGPRVLILGRRTTDDGTGNVADLDPYNASDEGTVIDIFGDGCDLHRGYLEALAGGAQRVILVALPSDTLFDHDAGTLTSSSYSTANPLGDLFDDAFSAVETAQPDIVVPWGRGGGPTEFEVPATPDDAAEFGFHANNATDENSWVVRVSQKMAQITNESNPCFAILGVKPYEGDVINTSGGMTPAQVASHLQLADLVSKEGVDDADDTIMVEDFNDPDLEVAWTNGPYVNVVVAEMEPLGYNKNNDFGFSNGAAMYAGFIAQLDSWSAPTGKIIFNVKSVRYNPTRSQQLSLIEKGAVPVALNFNKTPIWVDAQTFHKTGSDYARLTTIRIIFDAVNVVRQVSTRFIGEGVTVEMQHAFETAVRTGLRGMQQLGALLASDFAVQYVPVENRARVDLVLAPAFELRNIDVFVAVQF